MAQVNMSLRIDAELKDAFMAAAKSMDRNGSQLIRHFMRQTVERHKKIAAKIRMGQSKHFRPGTLKKYQAEMEKLEAEQKKRRDELLDKGDEILARLGEE